MFQSWIFTLNIESTLNMFLSSIAVNFSFTHYQGTLILELKENDMLNPKLEAF